MDDENDIPQDRDWYEYWRLLFAKISEEDIKDFENKYRGEDVICVHCIWEFMKI